jgi:alpha-tubulin suppressor-like RCC1 family protein
MTTGYKIPDPVFGTVDVDDTYITESQLVDRYVGGTLFTWGQNNYGQLGNGNTTYYSSPIQIGSLTNWKQVSCSINSTLAIKTDGTLWAWGSNTYGSLGNGTITSYSSPIQIGALTDWKQVVCSIRYSGAIKTDGTLWSWGGNDYGQLGNGNTTHYSSPIQIGSLTNWKQVAPCESYTAFAIKTDGTLWGMGRN